MNVKLTDKELEQYARDLFKEGLRSFSDMEDSVVGAFVKKVVEKHSVPLSILGHSINGSNFPVKVPQSGAFGAKQPQQLQQRGLFDELLIAQAAVAEQRI